MIALILVLALQDDIVKESEHVLDAGAVINVRTVLGRVLLAGTDEKTARVKTVKRGRDRERVEIKIKSDKGSLSVEACFPKRRLSDLEIEIEIDIQVPRTAKRLEADVVSGTIEVKDAKGDADLTSVSGLIRVDGLTGDLKAVSISGKVRIARLSADKASVTLTSGTLDGAGEVRDLAITSVSGGIAFDVTPKAGAWSVKSTCISGDVALRFPASVGAKIELKSLSGRLKSELELRDARNSDRGEVDQSLRGTFGDGTGSVRASTISGDVTLSRIK